MQFVSIVIVSVVIVTIGLTEDQALIREKFKEWGKLFNEGKDVQSMYSDKFAGNSTYKGYDGSAKTVHLLEMNTKSLEAGLEIAWGRYELRKDNGNSLEQGRCNAYKSPPIFVTLTNKEGLFIVDFMLRDKCP